MANEEPRRGRRGRRSRQRQQREEMEAKRRRRYMIFGGAIAAAVLLVVALTILNPPGNGDEPDLPPVQVAEAGYDGIPNEPYFLGDPEAPVHLVEWSDYQ